MNRFSGKYLFIIVFTACFALQLIRDYLTAIMFRGQFSTSLMVASVVMSLIVIGIWILLGYVALNILLFFCRIINPDFNINRYVFLALWLVSCIVLYLLILPNSLFMEMIITG